MTAKEYYDNTEWNWNSFDDLYKLFKLIHEELKTYSTCGICWEEVDFQEIIYSICDFKTNRTIGYFWSEKELAEFMIDNLTNIDW